MRMLHPMSLDVAFGLAKVQEEYVTSNRRNRRLPGPIGGNNTSLEYGNLSFKPSIPVQKVSLAEMKERRYKGLCYLCEEKWNPSHKCKKAKFFVLEGTKLFQEEKLEVEQQEVHQADGNMLVECEVLEISLHAIARYLSLRTTRVSGKIKDYLVVLLIDTGSIQTFLIQ